MCIRDRTYVTSAEFQSCGINHNANGDPIEEWMRTIHDETTQCDTIYFKSINQTTGTIEQSQTVLRYIAIDQLNQLLTANNFAIQHQYGYWDKSPFTPQSKEIITICQKQ